MCLSVPIKLLWQLHGIFDFDATFIISSARVESPAIIEYLDSLPKPLEENVLMTLYTKSDIFSESTLEKAGFLGLNHPAKDLPYINNWRLVIYGKQDVSDLQSFIKHLFSMKIRELHSINGSCDDDYYSDREEDEDEVAEDESVVEDPEQKFIETAKFYQSLGLKVKSVPLSYLLKNIELKTIIESFVQ